MNTQTNSAVVRAANTFLKKITPKTVCGAIGFDLLNQQRPVPPRHLYDVFGVVRNAQIKPDASGQGRKDSIRFSGRFQAVTQEGVEFDSPVMYLPGGMDEVLFDALKSAQAANADATVHVSLSIGIKTADPTKPSATGYEFDVQRIAAPVAESPDDPIARLRAQAVEVRQAKLAAPVSAAVTAGSIATAAAADTAPASETSPPEHTPSPSHKRSSRNA